MTHSYESPEAFSRAFKTLHGVMPTSARDLGVKLKAYPKMTFLLSVKGDAEMNYRVEKRKAFEMFGVFGVVSSNMEQAFTDVPGFVKERLEDGTWDRLNGLLGRPADTWFHAAFYDHTETSMKVMMCCYAPPGLDLPEAYTRLPVPAQTWAIFPVPGAPGHAVQDIWRRVYSEWFPTSGYEQAEGPSFEMYYGYGRGDHDYGVSEVWIPVRKR